MYRGRNEEQWRGWFIFGGGVGMTLHIFRTTFALFIEAVPQSEMSFNPYPTAFPYGNGMVLHFYQQQESSTTKTVHKVINKGLKTYV